MSLSFSKTVWNKWACNTSTLLNLEIIACVPWKNYRNNYHSTLVNLKIKIWAKHEDSFTNIMLYILEEYARITIIWSTRIIYAVVGDPNVTFDSFWIVKVWVWCLWCNVDGTEVGHQFLFLWGHLSLSLCDRSKGVGRDRFVKLYRSFLLSVDVYSLRSIILLIILELYRAGSAPAPRLDTQASERSCLPARWGGWARAGHCCW
jgi:hypothetical protein